MKEELQKIAQDSESEYVFANPQTNKPYSDIKKQFKTLCDAAEIKNFTFHDLRHTAATRLVELGVDLVVAEIRHLKIKKLSDLGYFTDFSN